MRTIFQLCGCGLLISPLFVPGVAAPGETDAPAPEPPGAAREPEPSTLPPWQSDQHEECAVGCSPTVESEETLSETNWRTLLAEWSAQPLDQDSLALDTLLFHADQARSFGQELGWAELSEQRRAWLERELSVNSAELQVRLTRADGSERVQLEPSRMHFGVKKHLLPEHAEDLQPPEISGTVVRVGLRHIWVRL